jgi:hypothetical protein
LLDFLLVWTLAPPPLVVGKRVAIPRFGGSHDIGGDKMCNVRNGWIVLKNSSLQS